MKVLAEIQIFSATLIIIHGEINKSNRIVKLIIMQIKIN